MLKAIFLAGILLRIVLFLTPAHATLQSRPELSTPLTSWRSLQEGVFIHAHGSDPYDGGVFYHSPIYLGLFANVPAHPALSALIWIAADVIAAAALLRIWTSRKGDHKRDSLVAAAYLLNPYALFTSAARSSTSIDNALLLSAISQAACGHALSAGSLLALASHSTLYPLTMIIPLVALTGRARTATTAFVTSFAAVSMVSYLLLGANWPKQTWGTILTVSDLTPNVGMWWYFFTEMFDHFRPFFLGVFQLHNVIYLAPLCLRFNAEPLTNILILLGITSTWKSYPQLGDHAAWTALLACFPEIVSNLRHPLFTASVHLYTSILLPLLHSLWLLTGAGNANFFYAATMVYGLNASLAVVDVVSAAFKARLKGTVPPGCELVQLTSVE